MRKKADIFVAKGHFYRRFKCLGDVNFHYIALSLKMLAKRAPHLAGESVSKNVCLANISDWRGQLRS
jgi:hypothetical protein